MLTNLPKRYSYFLIIFLVLISCEPKCQKDLLIDELELTRDSRRLDIHHDTQSLTFINHKEERFVVNATQSHIPEMNEIIRYDIYCSSKYNVSFEYYYAESIHASFERDSFFFSYAIDIDSRGGPIDGHPNNDIQFFERLRIQGIIDGYEIPEMVRLTSLREIDDFQLIWELNHEFEQYDFIADTLINDTRLQYVYRSNSEGYSFWWSDHLGLVGFERDEELWLRSDL